MKTEAAPIFVVQRHEARTAHTDFRLERDDVLRSWALPKGVPLAGQPDHLAVPTDDHDLAFASFEGEIPEGKYGAGTVRIVDLGTYRAAKWTEDLIVVDLAGDVYQGRWALIHMRSGDWLMHCMGEVPDWGAPAV